MYLDGEHCGHINRMGRTQNWCGVVGCDYECCDPCYEGHLLTHHFFDAPTLFRLSVDNYNGALRGQWAKDFCCGTTTKAGTPGPRK